MVRYTGRGVGTALRSTYLRSLQILLFCFLAGSVLGGFLFYHFPTRAAFPPKLGWSSFFAYLRYYVWPMPFLLIAGCSSFGLLIDPLLFAYVGTTASQLLLILIKTSTAEEVLGILSENLITSLPALQVFFLLGVHGMCGARLRFSSFSGRRSALMGPGFARAHLLQFLICLLVTAAAAVLNLISAPFLAHILHLQ